MRPSPDRPSTAAPRPLPTAEELAALDVGAFLSRLDHNVAALSSESSLASLVPPDVAADLLREARFPETDALFRSTLRGLLVATSFRDLPVAARAHPAVQERLWSAMSDMDTAVYGIADTLSSLGAGERSAVTRALRDDPGLADRVLDALDTEARKAGISDERRAHLREMGKHAAFRLRQSTSAFIDEYTSKIEKTPAREAPEAERYLAAQLGDATFHAERTWHLAVAEKWHELLAADRARLPPDHETASPPGPRPTAHLAGPDDPGGLSPDDAYAPPAAPFAPPPAGGNPDRGKTVLKVGAWLFGIGLLCGATGSLLVSVDSKELVIAGLVSLTAAAVLSIGGVLCLLIGGILRAIARSEGRQLP